MDFNRRASVSAAQRLSLDTLPLLCALKLLKPDNKNKEPPKSPGEPRGLYLFLLIQLVEAAGA